MKSKITVMAVYTTAVASDEFVVKSPAIIHICQATTQKVQNVVLIPLYEIKGDGPAEVRKKAHEMVDKVLDDHEKRP
jgi:hypothetical protein